MRIEFELTDAQAAALKRFCEKTSFEAASAVLYPHVNKDIRNNQAHDILAALDAIDKALAELRVYSHPWIETGQNPLTGAAGAAR